jgi:hypothetical protein
LKPRLFFCYATDSFPSEEKFSRARSSLDPAPCKTFQYEASFTPTSCAATGILFVTVCLVQEYSCCVPRSQPPLQRTTSLSKRYIRLFVILLARPDTHIVCTAAEYINAKRNSTNSLYMIKCKYYLGSKANLIFHFSCWSITTAV